jgi:hemerythrin-like domain-containing protein
MLMSKVSGKEKRHSSLIPLSREHHYALMLCLRINKGMKENENNFSWLKKKAENAVKFFESELVMHFRAEEEVLFPATLQLSAESKLIDELLSEHRKMERLIDRLRYAEAEELAGALNEFVVLLESHIRKEERDLFPVYERSINPEIAHMVEEKIIELIGTAIEPKNPEVLELPQRLKK